MKGLGLYGMYKWMKQTKMNYEKHLTVLAKDRFSYMTNIFEGAVKDEMLRDQDCYDFYQILIAFILNHTGNEKFKNYLKYCEVLEIEPLEEKSYKQLQEASQDSEKGYLIRLLGFFKNHFRLYFDAVKKQDKINRANELIEFIMLTELLYADNDKLHVELTLERSLADIAMMTMLEELDMDYSPTSFLILDDYDKEFISTYVGILGKTITINDIEVDSTAHMDYQMNEKWVGIPIYIKITYNDDQEMKLDVRSVEGCKSCAFDLKMDLSVRLYDYISE